MIISKNCLKIIKSAVGADTRMDFVEDAHESYIYKNKLNNLWLLALIEFVMSVPKNCFSVFILLKTLQIHPH